MQRALLNNQPADKLPALQGWQRGFLLSTLLLAFAHAIWQLDAKAMWWDESLSLQRAESDWGSLLRGILVMSDGVSSVATTDQHPFLFFLVQGILLRVAGISEFVLRFPSVGAATLLVAIIWVVARNYVRGAVLPAATPYWAVLLAAINPFLLWYGQEARPYALWAALALLHCYLLLRLVQQPVPSTRLWAGYVLVTLLHLSTHYYAIFVLPVHALAIFVLLLPRYRLRAVLIGSGILGVGVIIALWLATIVLGQGGGGNFSRIGLPILLADLLNAFSMGLSVNIDNVRWLNWLFGLLVLIGLGTAIRTRPVMRRGGWLLPSLIAVPITAVIIMSQIQPGYMNARHLSLLVGFFILAAAGGLAVIWRYQRYVSMALAAVLVAGIAYSTYNYFTAIQYSKDDYRAMGHYLEANLLPGDLLLLSPSFSWRIFDYYLPTDQVDRAAARGVTIATQNMPLLNDEWDATFALLTDASRHYRRIWLARSGTHPFLDPEGRVKSWLLEHSAVHLKETKFHSSDSFLTLDLFLPIVPVAEGEVSTMTHRLDVTFGEQIRLVGYDVTAPIDPTNALPITLYWQIRAKTDLHYKYILRLSEVGSGPQATRVAVTEREPYDGVIPTSVWDPGKTIIEYSELPLKDLPFTPDKHYQLTLQIYRADTFEKLPLTTLDPTLTAIDEQTVLLPLPLFD